MDVLGDCQGYFICVKLVFARILAHVSVVNNFYLHPVARGVNECL